MEVLLWSKKYDSWQVEIYEDIKDAVCAVVYDETGVEASIIELIEDGKQRLISEDEIFHLYNEKYTPVPAQPGESVPLMASIYVLDPTDNTWVLFSAYSEGRLGEFRGDLGELLDVLPRERIRVEHQERSGSSGTLSPV